MARPFTLPKVLARFARILVLTITLVLLVLICTQQLVPRHVREPFYDVQVVAQYREPPDDHSTPANRNVTWLVEAAASRKIHVIPMISSYLPYPTRTPDMDSLAFVFGARIRQIDDWLPNWHTLMRDHPGATCTIVIVSTSERHVDDMVQRMHAVHLDCKIELSTHRDVRRDYALAPLSAQQHHKDSTGHWPDYVIVSDDDTVYLDMRQYRRMLSRYDPSIPYFIGSASDTAQRRHVEGAFAYGGASMIITSALLGSMHGNYEQCLEDLPKEEFGGGDLYLALCTSRAIGLQPQRTAHRARDMTEFFNFQSGLHQCDYTGNGDGFYQSGERFLTLHHFLSKIFSKPFPAFIDHQISLRCTVLAAQRIGGQNLYKRFVFEQGRQLWVPGHSFTRYSRPIAQEDFALMEVTMKEVYFLEPTRPGITEGIDASVEENTKQTFYLSATSARSPTSTVLGYTASDNSTMTILVHHEAVDI